MKLSMATMLGLTRLDNPECQDKIITFPCWANTHSVGNVAGVRDASPGFLQVSPNYVVKPSDLEDEELLETMLQSASKRVIFPFSIVNGGKPRAMWSVPGDLGIIVESFEPVTWPYDTKDSVFEKISDVDFDAVMRELYGSGPVSIVIKSNEKLVSGLCKLIKDTKDIFDYSHALHCSIERAANKDMLRYGNAELRMSFFKPSTCVPFFGENSGGVMHLAVIQPNVITQVKKVLPLIEMVILFTNNVDTVVDVDGSGSLYGSTVLAERLPKIIRDCSQTFELIGGKETVAR